MPHTEDPANPSIPKEELTEKGFAWVNQASHKGDWAEAAARWAVLRAAYPDHPATWFRAIVAHRKAHQIAQAQALYRTASRKFPNHPSCLIEGASLASARNETDIVDALMAKARKNHPQIAESWLESARLDIHHHNGTNAESYLAEAIQRFPQNPNAYREHAEFAMQQQQWAEALVRWETFRTLFPQTPLGYSKAAEAAEQLGDRKLARKLRLAISYGDKILQVTDESQPKRESPKQHAHSTLKGLAELVLVKALFNLRSEVQRSYFGYLWWGLEPVLHMTVYYIVFAKLLGGDRENYPLFLLTGLVPWMWFMKSVIASSNSIINNHGLMMQVNIPVIIFPLVCTLQTTIKQLVVFFCLFLLLWILDYQPQNHLLSAAPLFAIQLLITTATGAAFAAVIPFLRDLNYLVPTGMTFMMFLSGIFYDPKDIAPEWKELFMYNPMAYLIDAYRTLFLEGGSFSTPTVTAWLLASLGLNAAVLYSYKRLQYVYPRVVMQ